ncbi:MAG: hypothetical protein Q6373_016295 [Candidatus Sigynarchaeota archaeon]
MSSEKRSSEPDSLPFWHGGIKAIDDLAQSVMASKPKGKENRIVTVPIDKEAIKRKAEEIASWKNTYDTSVWLFAEAEVRLADAYVTVLDGTSPDVKIDASKVVDVPTREATESLAKAISSHRPRLSEVHWFLAERRYIYDKVKEALSSSQ